MDQAHVLGEIYLAVIQYHVSNFEVDVPAYRMQIGIRSDIVSAEKWVCYALSNWIAAASFGKLVQVRGALLGYSKELKEKRLEGRNFKEQQKKTVLRESSSLFQNSWKRATPSFLRGRKAEVHALLIYLVPWKALKHARAAT